MVMILVKQVIKEVPKATWRLNALYGKPGGGAGGSSLELSGWIWDEIPSPNVPNNESGRLVFEIQGGFSTEICVNKDPGTIV